MKRYFRRWEIQSAFNGFVLLFCVSSNRCNAFSHAVRENISYWISRCFNPTAIKYWSKIWNLCAAQWICVYGLGENKYGTRARARAENDVINLRAVKHALNVYFREFSRPVFKASKESEIWLWNSIQALRRFQNSDFHSEHSILNSRISRFALGTSKCIVWPTLAIIF